MIQVLLLVCCISEYIHISCAHYRMYTKIRVIWQLRVQSSLYHLCAFLCILHTIHVINILIKIVSLSIDSITGLCSPWYLVSRFQNSVCEYLLYFLSWGIDCCKAHTNRGQYRQIYVFMPWMRLRPIVRVMEWQMALHILDCTASVISIPALYLTRSLVFGRRVLRKQNWLHFPTLCEFLLERVCVTW